LVAERFRTWLSEHHPRGLSNELSERVAKSRAQSSEKPPSTQDPPRVSSGRIEVRSIAVSQELSALLAQATERIEREDRESSELAPAVPSDRPPEEPMAADPELHRIARRLLRDFGVISVALVIALLYPRAKEEDDEKAPKRARSQQLQTEVAQVTPEALAAGSGAPAQPAVPAAAPEQPSAQVLVQPTAAVQATEPAEAASQKRGFLSVSAVPWAEVRVDGRLLGATPRRSVALRAGKHVVNLSCPPLAHDTTLTVDLQPDQELRVSANMHESPPHVTTQ
jgi:hypothetical protein